MKGKFLDLETAKRLAEYEKYIKERQEITAEELKKKKKSKQKHRIMYIMIGEDKKYFKKVDNNGNSYYFYELINNKENATVIKTKISYDNYYWLLRAKYDNNEIGFELI